jgi:hypothetical protein
MNGPYPNLNQTIISDTKSRSVVIASENLTYLTLREEMNLAIQKFKESINSLDHQKAMGNFDQLKKISA